MKVIMRTALADNYIFLLPDDDGTGVAVVDPGIAGPVLDYLRNSGRTLTAILNTHHHRDHTGGNIELAKAYPGIPVYGGAGDRGRIPAQTHFLAEGDVVAMQGTAARVLDVPGHTRAHIAYYFPGDGDQGDLFSGDTVFGGTVGNLFEGTPDIMLESIRKIRALPSGTRIWAAHEYTLQYVRESARLDPGNELLSKRLKILEANSDSGLPTIPLDLQQECATNPFFRWDDPDLAAHLSKAPGAETFRYLCEIT
jgi:hydroxyacylglutathione hydrolase